MNTDYVVLRNCGFGVFILFALAKLVLSVGGNMALSSCVSDAKTTIKETTAILAQNPSNYDALTKRGYAHFTLFDSPDAISDYNAALSIYPSADLYNKRADAYEALGEHDKAEADRATAKNFKRAEPQHKIAHHATEAHKGTKSAW